MSEVYLAHSLVAGSGDHNVYLDLGGQVPLVLVCPVEGHVGAESLARSQGVHNLGLQRLLLDISGNFRTEVAECVGSFITPEHFRGILQQLKAASSYPLGREA